MPGIYLTALATTLAALALLAPVIWRLQQPADTRLLLLAGLVALPLQPLAFFLVRGPLDHWVFAHLGSGSTTYPWIRSLYAPLTEESAKLIPLLIPAIYRDVRRENFVRYALAIGLGFAIGEMWFIADRLARLPAYSALPFYQFGGYAGERLMTCFFHSAFTSVALWGLRRNFGLGIAGAMALHWIGNFPLVLKAWNVGGLGGSTWGILVQVWLAVYLVICLGVLAGFAFGKVNPARMLFARRRCPSCKEEYDPPLFALNFGSTRYERCPNCRRWHWTKPSRALPNAT